MTCEQVQFGQLLACEGAQINGMRAPVLALFAGDEPDAFTQVDVRPRRSADFVHPHFRGQHDPDHEFLFPAERCGPSAFDEHMRLIAVAILLVLISRRAISVAWLGLKSDTLHVSHPGSMCSSKRRVLTLQLIGM
jgi:hypothetical protein